jgi:TIR domain
VRTHDKDLFISYSSKDRAFVERLARDLGRYGVRVWWDQGEIKVGDSLNKKIQEGIFSSRWLAIAVLSDSSAGNKQRLAAMVALWTLRFPDLALMFIEIARVGPASIRRRALFYLGEMRARAALDVIAYCISDKTPEIRAEARAAHGKITGTMPRRT